MTIELITGTPGAGKTTFAVASRLVEESKRTITLESGELVKRRLVVAGVRGLVMDHERLPHKLTGEVVSTADVERFNEMSRDKEDAPVYQRLPGDAPLDVPAMVQNWWLWAKPGDLIVVDEAQFIAPRGTMGRKPPYWVQALEIHRHYGVDFIFITQHPGLIDAVIKALVGLHRHVRSVMGSPLCMVYVWDHASNPERFNLANKSQFLRRKAHYKLFHSSVAHVKPPTSGRSIIVIVPVLLAAVVLMGMQFTKRFSKPADASTAAAVASSVPGQGVGSSVASPARPAGFVDVPALQGCYSVGDDCRCQGKDGRRVRIALPVCKLSASSFDGLVQWERSTSKRYVEDSPMAPAGAASSPVPKLL